MAMSRIASLALFLTVALLLGPTGALPCGPQFPAAAFVLTGRPDGPYANYLRGDLGVLHSGYHSFDLVPAYRYLTGTGLTREEQQALLRKPDRDAKGRKPEDWVGNWLEARGKIKGIAAPASLGWHYPGGGIDRTETRNGLYYSYINCGEDAFRTAVTTLHERARTFGMHSPEIAAWAQAQDIVFSNCSKGSAIPRPLGPGADPAIRADRAYQIAAAHFYAGDYDQAEQLFRLIAEDRASPWSGIAPYLAARVLVRKATTKAGYGMFDAALMDQAEAALRSILRDRRLIRYHGPAQDLLDLVKARLRPAELMHELARALVKQENGQRLRETMHEYRYMLMNAGPEVRKTAMAADDITDWVLTFQDDGPDALEHAVERWERAASLPWLVAAISKMQAGHAAQQNVQTAADTLMTGSPAYATAAYHSIRLLVDAGDQDEARQRLDALLSDTKRFSGSFRNLLTGLRMRVSTRLDEFLQFAPQQPAEVGYGYGEEVEYTDAEIAGEFGNRKLLPRCAAAVLNGQLPVRLLADIAAGRRLTRALRRQTAMAAWMRAVMLDDDQTAKVMIPVLTNLAPELEQLLQDYNAAQTVEERRFAAVFLLLKHPGMKPYIPHGIGRTTPLDTIDNFRDNWWCSLGSEMGPLTAKAECEMSFLTRDEARDAKEQTALLRKVETAPNYLASVVLPWAEDHRDDPRVPEALHLLVRATRYGCTDRQTTNYSRAAFKLLHARYKGNMWTKKTPYYF